MNVETNLGEHDWRRAVRSLVTEAGWRMSYRDLGEGEDVVVLLHGWPQHSLMWHVVAPLLATRHRVIAPDFRGNGGSDIRRDGYDKKTLAEDVQELLGALGVKHAHVVGYDLGAGAAYALAALRPDLVRSLAFLEFGLPGFGYEQEMAPKPSWHPGANWHLGLFTIPDLAVWAFAGRERQLLDWFFAHLAYRADAVSSAHLEDYTRAVARPVALRAGVELYAAVWQDAINNKNFAQTKLAMPVLGIGGEASAGAWVELGLRPVASNVTGYVVPRAGHWLGDENPEALAKALLTFFEDQR
jgi:pimeloyl-ACP methyl ester carboxylesterase